MVTQHPALSRISALPVIAVWALLGCGGGAEADEPEPTVLESLEPAEGTEAQNNDDDASVDEEEQDPEPVPASSEGPAENWPEPEPPDEIYEPTEEGAEALIQYWFDARHYARITGDLEPLEYVSAEDCELCDEEIAVVEEIFENEGWFMGEPNEVLDSYARLESDTHATGVFGVREADFEAFWRGETYSTTDEESSGFQLSATYEQERWQLVDLFFLGEYDETLREGEDQ